MVAVAGCPFTTASIIRMADHTWSARKRGITVAMKNRIGNATDQLHQLRQLLEDRIADLHAVKGGQGERHAFILYRDKIYNIVHILRRE
jgi:hypothetical protein